AGTFAGLTQSAGLPIGDNSYLQQAFVSYLAPLGTGLRFDFGKFVTHLGYELIEGYDGYNDNYSRSLLFNYAIPLTHTGVKASYSISPKVSLMAMVVNGWDDAIDNNSSKSVGAQLMVKPADPVALYVNYIGGPENSDDNSSIRHVHDLGVLRKQLAGGSKLWSHSERRAERHAFHCFSRKVAESVSSDDAPARRSIVLLESTFRRSVVSNRRSRSFAPLQRPPPMDPI